MNKPYHLMNSVERIKARIASNNLIAAKVATYKQQDAEVAEFFQTVKVVGDGKEICEAASVVTAYMPRFGVRRIGARR